jgi:hypothetical protein
VWCVATREPRWLYDSLNAEVKGANRSQPQGNLGGGLFAEFGGLGLEARSASPEAGGRPSGSTRSNAVARGHDLALDDAEGAARSRSARAFARPLGDAVSKGRA